MYSNCRYKVVAAKGIYTAEQLAFKSGVPLRTVRYYVQEKLIDPPFGRGPGAHYGQSHLQQLQRARLYQLAGLDNKTIRQHADELEALLIARGIDLDRPQNLLGPLFGASLPSQWATLLGRVGTGASSSPSSGDQDIDPATAIRIPMAPGIELLVERAIDIPTPRKLVEIALLVRKIFALD